MKSKLTKEEAEQIIKEVYSIKMEKMTEYFKNNDEELKDKYVADIYIEDFNKIMSITPEELADCIKEAQFKNSACVADIVKEKFNTHIPVPNNVIAALMASIYMSLDDVHLKEFVKDKKCEYMWRCGIINNELYWMKINSSTI